MQSRVPSDHFPVIDTTKKNLSTSSSTSTPSLTATGSGGGDKKPATSHSIISSLKRLVSDVGNNNGIGNTTSASLECREELDGVERGEGTPLSHLTASRAKAPRRRPPSSQHLRHHAAGSAGINSSPTGLMGFPSVPTNSLLVKKDICENINVYISYTFCNKIYYLQYKFIRKKICLMDGLTPRWSKYRMKKRTGLRRKRGGKHLG